MKKKTIVKLSLIFSIMALLAVLCFIVYLNLKPSLISGHIEETMGIITEIKPTYIILKTEEGTVTCDINSKTYYVNKYVPKVGDTITAISDYDGDEQSTSIKCKRLYKVKEN